jgi:putative heme-binding domain-containing protein
MTTLAARAPYAKELLVALGAGTVPRTEVSASTLRRLRELADPEVDALVKEHFGVVRDTPEEKTKRIAELKQQLSPDALAHGDRGNGRALFAMTCMKCHVLFGAGRGIAPELTGSNRADLDYLLTNVIDPNAVIGKDYQVTNVFMKDDRIVSGLLTAQNDSAVTITMENGAEVLARKDIAALRPSPVSLMPEGQLDTMPPEAIRDLIAYLQSPVQVPMTATEATTAYLFNGKDLALWSGNPEVWSVEEGEIVGRTTTGLAHNDFLISDLLAGDFHLRLEVKLVKDEGNSGIQFRSVPVGPGPVHHEITGYQADVGPGWWGKLYEENARALLSDVSAESWVKKGEWNVYDIWAVGSRVRTAINGRVSTDLDDPKGLARGQIALQVHSGGPTEVRFRNLVLELAPAPLPPVRSAGS